MQHSWIGSQRSPDKAVLGRAGMFLALGEGVPTGFKVTDTHGIELAEETIIGDDLTPVVRAALNYRYGATLDENGYKQAFRLYFEYGCHRLMQIWDEYNGDQIMFTSALIKMARSGPELTEGSGSTAQLMAIVDHPVRVKLLADVDAWTINAVGGNCLTVISGKPGSGKSQLALDLLAQMSRQGVRFLFFDLKGELEDDPSNPQQTKTRNNVFQITGAKYIRLISEGLPINPLFRGKSEAENAQIASEVASLVGAFAPQLGANQERAIRDAFESLETPDFQGLANELEQRGEEGVALSILEKISKFNLFARADKAQLMERWLSSSQVIDFKPLGNDNDTKVLAVAFILNCIMRQLNRALAIKDGVQPVQMVLFVDEAHLLLPKEGKSGLLGSLAPKAARGVFRSGWLRRMRTPFSPGAQTLPISPNLPSAVSTSPHIRSRTQSRKRFWGKHCISNYKKVRRLCDCPERFIRGRHASFGVTMAKWNSFNQDAAS